MKTFYEQIIKTGSEISNKDIVDKSGFNYGEILSLLDKSVLIKIDNVAQYFWEISGQEYWDIYKDFPNCAPIFNNMFFEYQSPEFTNANGNIVEIRSEIETEIEIEKTGCLVLSEEIGKTVFYDSEKWVLNIAVISKTNRGISFWPGICSLIINKFGKILDHKYLISSYFDKEHQEYLIEGIRQALNPVLLALSFMHCKNIKQVEYIPKLHIGRSSQPRHAPRVKHYTLEIDPMKKILESEGGISRNGIQKALHICRGHFKNFTDDKPLFGKRTGTYWWSDQVRGKVENGVVEKDYSVLSPKA